MRYIIFSQFDPFIRNVGGKFWFVLHQALDYNMGSMLIAALESSSLLSHAEQAVLLLTWIDAVIAAQS